MTDAEFEAAIQRIDASLQRTRAEIQMMKDRDEITVGEMSDDDHFVGSLWTWERASRHSPVFALRLNLEYRRNVPMQELGDMIMSQDTSDISPLDLSGFYHTSVVVEAEDADGQLHYIAVITVFLALEADGIAAIRYAELLSRFTGKPAHAMVASMQAHKEFRGLVACEPVHWFCLDKRARTD